MRSIDPRFALVAVLALAGCGGGAVSSSIPAASLDAQSAASTTLSQQQQQHDDGKASAKYTGVIQDLVPPCGQPTYSCTGAFTVTLKRDDNKISGTWTEDFTNPTLHDQGTFTGVMTSPTTFKATFQSPTDAPCTLTVTGTLTSTRLDAAYVFNTTPSCPVTDNGTITLKRAGGGDDGDDHNRGGEREHGD